MLRQKKVKEFGLQEVHDHLNAFFFYARPLFVCGMDSGLVGTLSMRNVYTVLDFIRFDDPGGNRGFNDAETKEILIFRLKFASLSERLVQDEVQILVHAFRKKDMQLTQTEVNHSFRPDREAFTLVRTLDEVIGRATRLIFPPASPPKIELDIDVIYLDIRDVANALVIP